MALSAAISIFPPAKKGERSPISTRETGWSTERPWWKTSTEISASSSGKRTEGRHRSPQSRPFQSHSSSERMQSQRGSKDSPHLLALERGDPRDAILTDEKIIAPHPPPPVNQSQRSHQGNFYPWRRQDLFSGHCPPHRSSGASGDIVGRAGQDLFSCYGELARPFFLFLDR